MTGCKARPPPALKPQTRDETTSEGTTMEAMLVETGRTQGQSGEKTLALRRTAIAALVVLGAAFAAGCAGNAKLMAEEPPSARVSIEPSPAAPAPVVSFTEEAPAGAAPSPMREQSRPGLGTEWGEERDSPIRDVAFERADRSRPLVTTELRYNDERGVNALASYVADHGHRAHQSTVAGGAITLWLQDGSDNPLDVVQVAGHTFVVGEAGQRYTIVLENHTGHRFEAVTTVDGLDVISGKTGSVQNRGYLLLPYATLEIDGFRQSAETVAAFRFGRVADSYAAKVGAPRNVGVIGIAFFGEGGDAWSPWGDDDVRRRATASPFPADHGDNGRFAPPPRW
jgi:hypothetical protein